CSSAAARPGRAPSAVRSSLPGEPFPNGLLPSGCRQDRQRKAGPQPGRGPPFVARGNTLLTRFGALLGLSDNWNWTRAAVEPAGRSGREDAMRFVGGIVGALCLAFTQAAPVAA